LRRYLGPLFILIGLSLLFLIGCATRMETLGRIDNIPIVQVRFASSDTAWLVSTPHGPNWTFVLHTPSPVPAWWVHEMCHVALIAQGGGFGTERSCEVIRVPE